MKSIKMLFVTLLMAVTATPAFADQQVISSIIGAVAGGAGARALSTNVQSNAKRNMITVAGALGGAYVGSKFGDDSGQQHADRMAMQQQAIDQQRELYNQNRASSGYARSAQYASYEQPTVQTYPVGVDRQPAPVVTTVVQQPVMLAAPSHRAASNVPGNCAREKYYRGQYNPPAAQAFCVGQQERILRQQQAIQEAYQEGLEGEN